MTPTTTTRPSRPRLCVTIPSMQGAGCERMLAQVLPYYAERFDVDLVLLEDRISYALPPNLNIVSLDTPLQGYRGMFKAIRSLRKHFSKHYYDAIISYLDLYNVAVAASLLFKSGRPAHVACEHTTDREYFRYSRMPASRQALLKRALRFAYARADRVIAVSENLKGFLIEDLHVKTPIDVIHNAIDPKHFNLEPADRSNVDAAFSAAKVRLLCISRLDYQKNIPFLIKSFAKIAADLPDAELFILGDGPERGGTEKLILEMRLDERVHLLGFRSNPWDYLKLSSVFLLASRYESFGNVVVESLACGVPVVTTNYGKVVHEILTREDMGTVVKQGDVTEFANAVVATVAKSKEGRAFEISRYATERFNIASKAEQYIDVVELAMTQSRNRQT